MNNKVSATAGGDHRRRVGELLTGPIAGYEVLSTVGHGAGSTIYAVRDPKDGKRYALKRVVREGNANDRFVKQLLTEFEVSGEIDHPAIRKCYKVKRIRSLLRVKEVCMVMEFIDGVPLSERQPKSIGQLVKVFQIVARALAAMDSAGYVHADTKPSNILITADGKVRVIDLGQSCPRGTIKQRIQGTPDYIAPEQVKRRPLTAQTDMFNLGATMYWCLTGRHIPTLIPKTDEHGHRVKSREKFYAADKLNAEVPFALNKLVMGCLRTSPANRPEHWQQVIDQLELVALQCRRTRPAPTAARVEAPARPTTPKRRGGTQRIQTV